MMRRVEEGVVGVVVRSVCDDKDDDDSDDVWRCVERRVGVSGMWRRWALRRKELRALRGRGLRRLK